MTLDLVTTHKTLEELEEDVFKAKMALKTALEVRIEYNEGLIARYTEDIKAGICNDSEIETYDMLTEALFEDYRKLSEITF